MSGQRVLNSEEATKVIGGVKASAAAEGMIMAKDLGGMLDMAGDCGGGLPRGGEDNTKGCEFRSFRRV